MRFVTEYIDIILVNSQLPTPNSQKQRSRARWELGIGSWELTSRPRFAVLFSSGLDSAVLAASEARTSDVHPLYVSTGLAWERDELTAVDRLLATPAFSGMATVARLAFTVTDLYPPTHWALRGTPP